MFWRSTPLTDPEQTLLTLVLRAHHQSAFRNNVSSAAVVNAATGSCDYAKAIGSALLSIGGVHAPIVDTMRLLKDLCPDSAARRLLDCGLKVPGWGNSFTTTEDSIWSEVAEQIQSRFPEMQNRFDSVTEVLHEHGKFIYPNPSCYTAACAILIGLPELATPWLFIRGRLDGWSELFCKTLSL